MIRNGSSGDTYLVCDLNIESLQAHFEGIDGDYRFVTFLHCLGVQNNLVLQVFLFKVDLD